MSDPTPFDQATTMIKLAWGQPINDLEELAGRHPVRDPLLRSAMHIRAALVVSSNAAVVHQERLHAMARPGQTPAFYDQERITQSAVALRIAHAESQARVQAIGNIIDAREAALSPDRARASRLAQAAVARSVQAPHVPAQPPGRAAVPAPDGPTATTSRTRR